MGGITKRRSSGVIQLDGGVDEYHDPIEVANNRKLSAIDIHIDGKKLKKRPGRQVWGPTFGAAFNGAHEYIDPDGTIQLIVASNGNIYSVDASTKTALDTGLSEEELHFQTHRGRCYYNGSTTQRKLTRTTAARIGIVAPTGAPTAVYASGALTGDYSWKFTFVIEESGIKVWESNPSPALDYVLSSQKATLQAEASYDSRVNARYFYRTTPSGSIYQYVGKISDNSASSTFVDAVSDALLGDIVETTHGVPITAKVTEGANYRMFSIDGDKLRWSEQAFTESYLEYQRATNFHILPKGGLGVGLKHVYNANSAKDDLYVWQSNATMILPDADPTNPLVVISESKGLEQQDTIVQYLNSLVFFSKQKTVEMIVGNRLVDISSRNIPQSIASLIGTQYARATLLYGKYYALCCRSNAIKLYNHQVWICDLSTVQEVKSGFADATWYKWEINAEYLLERQDGTILAFDNSSQRIFKYSDEYKNDTDASGNITDIPASFQTKDFHFGMFARINPCMVILKGKQTGTITITSYYGNNFRDSDIKSISCATGAVAIAGRAIAGSSKATQIPYKIECSIPKKVVGSWVGFKFTKESRDLFFELTEIEISYVVFERI